MKIYFIIIYIVFIYQVDAQIKDSISTNIIKYSINKFELDSSNYIIFNLSNKYMLINKTESIYRRFLFIQKVDSIFFIKEEKIKIKRNKQIIDSILFYNTTTNYELNENFRHYPTKCVS